MLNTSSSLLLDQFGALGLVAGVIGAVHYSFSVKWLRWILVWLFITYFAFAVGYNTQDSVGYLMPALMVFAVWIGLALPSLWQLSWKRIPLGTLLAALLVASIGLRIPGTRLRLDPRSQDQPARYAEQLLQDAPPHAVVYTSTDGDTFPLWYYHFGLGVRPDLRLVVLPLTQFAWYGQTLAHTYPDLVLPTAAARDSSNHGWGYQVQSLNPQRAACITHLSDVAETGVEYLCTGP